MGGGAEFDPSDLRKPLDTNVKMQHPTAPKVEFIVNKGTSFKHSRWYSFVRNRKFGLSLYGATLLGLAVWWIEFRPIIDRIPILGKVELLKCLEADALTDKMVREAKED